LLLTAVGLAPCRCRAPLLTAVGLASCCWRSPLGSVVALPALGPVGRTRIAGPNADLPLLSPPRPLRPRSAPVRRRLLDPLGSAAPARRPLACESHDVEVHLPPLHVHARQPHRQRLPHLDSTAGRPH
jgi:hypothetical protein